MNKNFLKVVVLAVTLSFSLTAFAAPNSAPVAKKSVAITIDDLPIIDLSKHTPEAQVKIIQDVIEILAKHHISATGFVIGKNVQPVHHAVLTEFVRQGNTIGNHSYSHLNPHKVPIKVYLSDVEKGQNSIQKWANKTKFYRFPFLNEGRSELDYTKIQKYLSKHHYVVAHVTIDNDDWIFNRDYVAALQSSDIKKAKAIAHDYVEHMKEQTHHFELRAQEIAGRPINQILLLHMSKINADYLDQLLSWYEKDGYQFVSLDEALKDSIYKWQDRFRGEGGISWLDRIIEPNEK